MRTSPVHYIAPSAISIIPNANGSHRDLAVYIAQRTKIKVRCPRAGIGTEEGNYQEWTLTGRNRRLADTTGTIPYTIYARLSKTGEKTGYLVFSKKYQRGNDWIDDYSSLTLDEKSKDGYSVLYTDNGFELKIKDPSYYYIRLGDVSAAENDERTVTLDTGILGTDQYNNDWAQNPDDLPLRIELGCTINDEDVGLNPYVYWDQSLVLTASLVEGWSGTDIQRFDHWEILRKTDDSQAESNWLDSTRETAFSTSGEINLSHGRSSDDFNGAVATTFTIMAMERDPEDDSKFLVLKSATITILAETWEKYELALSSAIVSYSPQTGDYNPVSGVAVRIRATDQRGDVFELTNKQYADAGLQAFYVSVGGRFPSIPNLRFTGADNSVAVATIPTAGDNNAFATQQSLNVRLARADGTELALDTIAFVRDGEDSKEREWIFLRSATAITFTDNTKPANIAYGQVNPPQAAGHDTDESNQDGWVPEGWWDEMQGTSKSTPYEYGAYRDYDRDTEEWGAFSEPRLWSHFGKDGDTVQALCSIGTLDVECDSSGNVKSGLNKDFTFTLTVNGTATPPPTISVKTKPSGISVQTHAEIAQIPIGGASISIVAGTSRDNLQSGIIFIVSYQEFSAELVLPVICSNDGSNAHEVNPNILLRTVFDRGIDFVKEKWESSDWNYIGIDTADDTVVNGRKSLCINASSLSTHIGFSQNVYGRIKTSTWYTLSFNYFATNRFRTFAWDGANTNGIVDRTAGYYIDGVFNSSNLGIDGNYQWPAEWRGERHSLTFKTNSEFRTTEANILFRCYEGGQLAICMPKLEEGQVATAYLSHEDDLVGEPGGNGISPIIYSLQCTPSAVNFRSDAVGNYFGNYTVSCKVMKTVGNVTSEVSASGGTYDGMYLKHHELGAGGSYNLWTQASSISLNPGDALDSQFVATEFALASDSSMTNIVARTGVPITIDGHVGAAGATGRMFRPRGVFDPTTEYIRDDNFVDLVFFDDGTYNNVNSGRGHYYYISDMARTNKNGATYYAPAATDGSGNTYDYLSGIWTLAPDYGLVITQGVFAEFAKLGKAIMSGDYMFSTNGRIGSTEYNDGALLGGVPAYTSFSPEMAEGKTLSLTLAQVSSVKETYTPFTETFPVIAGVTYTITVTAKTNTSEGKAYFTTNQGNGYIDAVNGTSYQTITKNITATRTGIGYVSACVDASGQTVTIKSVTVQGGFEPNWWVDLRTGKMSAARGNFVVEPSGNVYVQGEVYANSGEFSGLLKKVSTIINSSNISNYQYESVFGPVFDFAKAGTFLVFSDLTKDVTMYMYGVWGYTSNNDASRKEYVRGLVGNRVLIYNKSSRSIAISGHTVINGNEGSFNIVNGQMCSMECKIRGYGYDSIHPDREGYEDIYWDCTVLKID